MKELDLLKKDWQKNEDIYPSIQEVELYKMLHQKSSSIVKRIFIISVLEILLWTTISIVWNTDDYIKNMRFQLFFEIFNYFNYAITIIFIVLFYKNYVAISTTVSTKKLMNSILKTRKTVQYYVLYNLIIVVISMIIGFYIGIVNNNKSLILKDDFTINNVNILLFVALILVTIGVIFGLFWLFYRLLYGILLRKLYANYKELKKMEE
ncbi:hypothetical protein [Flavobacterium sp.]|uniref:hypothetical protein n=1 Tax=Flavobacterium sp. TaxID=239 RepID=UPI0038FCAB51